MDPVDRSVRARSFGAIADDYDRFRPGPPAEIVEWLLPQPCADAVDIGAGTGALTRELVRLVDHVIAVEPDSRMAELLASRVPLATVRSGTAEELPLPDASVDAVVGSSMWHWVDEARAAREAARVLRPGGVLGLLWSGPDRSQGWLAELLASSRGTLAAKIDDGRRRHRHEVQLPPDAPFDEPERRVLQWSLPMTGDELIGLAGTYSGWIVLPAEERARVHEQLTEAVGNHLARSGRDTIELPMGCTAWRAVRRA